MSFTEDSRLQDDGKCIRFRDKNGEHKLSLLPCGMTGDKVTNVDLCQPDGRVIYCGVPIKLVNVFAVALGLEEISDKPKTTMARLSG